MYRLVCTDFDGLQTSPKPAWSWSLGGWMDDADDGGGDGDGDGKDLRLSFLYVQTPDQPGAWRGTSYVILPPWPISPVLFLPRAVPRGSDDLAYPIMETFSRGRQQPLTSE